MYKMCLRSKLCRLMPASTIVSDGQTDQEKAGLFPTRLLDLPCLKPGEKLDFYQTKHNLEEPSVILSFGLTLRISLHRTLSGLLPRQVGLPLVILCLHNAYQRYKARV